MNQVFRQNAKTSIEKDLYKLMNSANFGHDCHKNPDNCTFVPVFDEIEELSFPNAFRIFSIRTFPNLFRLNFSKNRLRKSF